MIRLERSEALQRQIRKGDPEELAVPSWNLIREYIMAGRKEEALELIDYEREIFKGKHDSIITLVNNFVEKMIAIKGEAYLEEMWRERYGPRVERWTELTPGVKETLERWMEDHRGHQSNIKLTEEPDRYVVALNPCGSGGRLRRTVQQGTTSQPYPWSWSQKGIPYYCTHCCLSWEILPIEQRGYPVKVCLPGAGPLDPCVNFFYKRPELIPEEYFTRVGKKKTIK